MSYELQFFITAIVFTLFGSWIATKTMAKHITQSVVEELIDDGFLKTTTDEEGEVFIVKYDEDI